MADEPMVCHVESYWRVVEDVLTAARAWAKATVIGRDEVGRDDARIQTAIVLFEAVDALERLSSPRPLDTHEFTVKRDADAQTP